VAAPSSSSPKPGIEIPFGRRSDIVEIVVTGESREAWRLVGATVLVTSWLLLLLVGHPLGLAVHLLLLAGLLIAPWRLARL